MSNQGFNASSRSIDFSVSFYVLGYQLHELGCTSCGKIVRASDVKSIVQG